MVGRAPNSLWELGMAESNFRESSLEKAVHKLYIGEFLAFSENKSGSGRKTFPPGRIAFAKMEWQEEVDELITGLLGLGWRVDMQTALWNKGQFTEGLEYWSKNLLLILNRMCSL